jgi:thiazole synthase
MELGFDAVLLNTAVARSGVPENMATAMALAVKAGRLAFKSDRIGKSPYGSASSPDCGVIAEPV